jgi:tRNA1(Val) A37 N6-methylase TrmN6
MTELELKCLKIANQIAKENGNDIFSIPDEDLLEVFNYLNRYNVEEIANKIAELAH